MYYNNGKISVNTFLDGYKNGINYGLAGIPTKLLIALQGAYNAKLFVDNKSYLIGDRDPNLVLQVTLKKKIDFWLDTPIETKTLDFFRTRENTIDLGGELYIDHKNAAYLNHDLDLLYHIPNQKSSDREKWFCGDPLIFNFDTTPQTEAEYYVEVKWVITGGPSFSIFDDPATKVYSFSNYESSQKTSMMIQIDPDIDNNYVVDSYQSCPGLSTVTDNRDGKIYNTVQIGDQCWLKENLNFGTRIDGNQDPSSDGILEKYCYEDNPENCNIYGGLYKWIEFKVYAGTVKNDICPKGWHVPTKDEFQILIDAVNNEGNALKREDQGAGDGKGTDVSGFSALLAGERFWDQGGFFDLNERAYFWTTTETVSGGVNNLRLRNDNNSIFWGSSNIYMSFSVRCLIDANGGIAPQAPTLLLPENGAKDVDHGVVNFLWNTTASALYYTLQVSTDTLFTNKVIDLGDWIYAGVSHGGGLEKSTQYFWRVNATNAYGTSEWSTTWTFTTEGEVPGGSSCPGLPTVTYSGKTYNTVQIGTQCWLKENLNVGTRINGNTDQVSGNGIEKYCYNDIESNCTTYGGLYQWNEAMQYVTTEGAKGICPTGWHIPTLAEFVELYTFNNASANGFYALMAGYRTSSGIFNRLGEDNWLWSSTESTDFDAKRMRIPTNLSMELGFSTVKVYGFSIRCIKN